MNAHADAILLEWTKLQNPKPCTRFGRTSSGPREGTIPTNPPAPIDDRAIVRHMIRAVLADLVSIDLLVKFDPNDVVTDAEADMLEPFSEWLSSRKRRPLLRAVEP